MEIARAREILDPEHREAYESLEPVNEACRMGVEALRRRVPESPYCGTHAEEEPRRQRGDYCQYCGHRLREIGRERFCNNVNCRNRYVNV